MQNWLFWSCFLAWRFKHARITVRTYFQRNHRQLNLVTYVERYLDFVLPLQVRYVTNLYENIIIFLFTPKNIMKALLIYNLIWSLLSSCFLTNTRCLRQITIFLRRYPSSVSFLLSSPVSSVYCPRAERVARPRKGRKFKVGSVMK